MIMTMDKMNKKLKEGSQFFMILKCTNVEVTFPWNTHNF